MNVLRYREKASLLIAVTLSVFASPVSADSTWVDEITNPKDAEVISQVRKINVDYVNLQQNGRDAIYQTLFSCVNKNSDNSGMSKCHYEAYEGYNALLDKFYHLVLASLNEPSKSQLKESQEKWLAYRDSEFKFHRMEWTGGWGSAIYPSIGGFEVDMVRERIYQLTLFTDGD